MDTVEEETSLCNSQESLVIDDTFEITTNLENSAQHRLHDPDEGVYDHRGSSSRRPSAIIAALRRPSQAFALSTAYAVMNQQRYLLRQRDRLDSDKQLKLRKHSRKLERDALTTILSAFYAKLLVVLGMAFPITEIISSGVRPFYYQGFYLYLYLGSIAFVAYMYGSLVREKSVFSLLRSYSLSKTNDKSGTPRRTDTKSFVVHQGNQHAKRYGSFYLRLGAIAFGIGSMVYSGLEFGRYFEMKNNQDCNFNALQAITPATRMFLTLVQVQFIFLNSKDLKLNQHKIVARFGLMHMIATNLCEWLNVLVEETKHEILHLNEHGSNETIHSNATKYCKEGPVMGSLVSNASPFLFPCTIEYSLICAVILYEMWKKIKTVNVGMEKDSITRSNSSSPTHQDKYLENELHLLSHHAPRSHYHISLDCSNAHKGLFAGILVIVLTIISLIMFFVLNTQNGTPEEKVSYKLHALFEVNMVELVLHVISIASTLIAMYQMKNLKYDRKMKEKGTGIGLDNTLLVVAQSGMFIYCMFSIIGCYFTISVTNSPAELLAEVFSFIQTCLQTMFVLDGWWRRCRDLEQTRSKPGRELVTFLIIANMAMWAINVMEKSRAEFRPTHLTFYGNWAWVIITHISMPLAIFYRFHSTICLFEIWKSAYKIKHSSVKQPFLHYL